MDEKRANPVVGDGVDELQSGPPYGRHERIFV